MMIANHKSIFKNETSKFASKVNSKLSTKSNESFKCLSLKRSFRQKIHLISYSLFIILMTTFVQKSVSINLKPKYQVNLKNEALVENRTTKLNEFNQAFSSFLNDWKIKNPTFDLESIKIDELKENPRDKRQISLEDDFDLALKNKKIRNDDKIPFERKTKSIENSQANNFNSLDDKIAENDDDGSTCISCKPHDDLKQHRLEQIKREILRKLNLEKPPTVNLSSVPRKLILDHFLTSNNDPNYQNDQSLDEYIDDDDDVRVKQVITFGEKGRNFI